jgi:cytidylate kinase
MLSSEAQRKSESSKAWVRQQKLKIAVDGPAGAGKSTVAQRVAQEIGYLYVDTGAMYRAATLLVLRAKIQLDHQKAITNLIRHSNIELAPSPTTPDGKIYLNSRVFLNKEDVTNEIRNAAVTSAVSAVSAVVPVRELLVEKQRRLAAAGAVILDGRDIGTVVLPDADLKIFLTASPEVRAQRRYDELLAKGEAVEAEVILTEIIERDRKDSSRAMAPLRPAQDAIMILTDNMPIEQVVDTIIKLCDRRETA